MDWADFTDPIVGTIVPNFFIFYFGQQLAYRNLSDDDVMAKLTCLGFGYELWANTAKDVIKTLDNILTIMEDMKTPEKFKKYFNPTWDASKSLPLATSNGPFVTMPIVQFNDYPVATHAIKDLFQLTQQAATNPGVFIQGNVMLQFPGEIDKESETKKGISIIKLMLLHVYDNINIDSTLIKNIYLASLLRGMQVVLNQPHTAGQFTDLVWRTLDLAIEQDYTNIRSSQVSIQVMSNALTSHMLQGNFKAEKVNSLELEVNLIKPSAFLPQKNA